MKNKHIKIVILLLSFIIISFSCREDETSRLIDSSVTTGNLISAYYDKLITYTIDTWELEAFNSSIRDIDFPASEQKEFQKTIDNLQARKKLVDTFVKMMPALKEFSENRSPDNFKQITTELGQDVNGITPLKDNGIIIPSEILGNMSQDITEICKYYELKYIGKNLVAILEKMNNLFVKETPSYLSIIEEWNNKSMSIVNYMIDNELVVPWSLIESAPGTVGFDLYVDKKPVKDARLKAAMKKVIEVKYFRMNYLLTQTDGDIVLLTGELISTYDDYVKGKKISFDNIMHIAEHANGYFTELNKYVDNLTGRTNYSPYANIVYHGNTDSKVFHSPSCPYYLSKSSIMIFNSREEAVKAGYSPCTTCKP
jgi:hypothetical protein